VNPLGIIFGGLVGARNRLYNHGILPVRKLQGPVISVGNLSAGGSGKTPFVILLGGLLQNRGVKFDVLSRGYGRDSRGVRLVDPAGLAQEFGDEPLLIARKLEARVVVGEDRYAAGCFAESNFGPQLHILDDGFQHRGLARDFDIVLVTPQDATDRMLPSGKLRETLGSLRRADAVVLASGASAESFPLDGKLVWRVRRGIEPKNVPARPIVFCGIARPQSFILQLRSANIEPIAEAFYRDHHAYDEKDVRELLELKRRSEAGGFVTTEKDAVNLGPYLSALDPLSVVPVRMELVDANAVLDCILGTLDGRCASS
jgi:tetraacyldisaccharide 4'-kinase